MVNGYYATVVNIHNPNAVSVKILKKVVLAYPEGSNPITPTMRFTDVIKSDHAMSVNCTVIAGLLTKSGIPVDPQFIEGYLVVDALPTAGTIVLLPLDVDTVHTTSQGSSLVSSIDAVHESGRILPAGAWPY